MTLLDNTYIPSEEEQHRMPQMAHIGSERFTCPCGEVLTWYSMDQVMDSIHFLPVRSNENEPARD